MHYNADTLDDYLHGALGPERDATIHAHLEACAECRALYDEAGNGPRLAAQRGARRRTRVPVDDQSARVGTRARDAASRRRSPIACARCGAR